MKSMIFLLAMLGNFTANAKTMIEVSEPAFNAERIEFNPITKSYVIVNPRYMTNGTDGLKIVAGGLSRGVSTAKAAQHLCTFLGMSGGRVISDSLIVYHKCNGNTLTIEDSGLYGITQFAIWYRDCQVIDYLECSPKSSTP